MLTSYNPHNNKNINKTIRPGILKKPINKIDNKEKGNLKPKNCPIKFINRTDTTPIINELIIYFITFFIKSPLYSMVI